MIRPLKRLWQLRKESRIAPRLQEVLIELMNAVPELEGVRAVRSGHRGHDSNYYLVKGGKKLAMLRLNNPHIARPAPIVKMPFMLTTPEQRITRELTAYELGAENQLTPKPLFHTKDALVCRYVPFMPLGEIGHTWDLFIRANRAIAALHALGLTHMDISPNNILVDKACDHFVFIDFEYVPVPGLSLPSQYAYDYLRLAESSWKFMPENIRGDFAPWLADITARLDTKQVDLKKLSPALTRILADSQLGPAIKKSFS